MQLQIGFRKTAVLCVLKKKTGFCCLNVLKILIDQHWLSVQKATCLTSSAASFLLNIVAQLKCCYHRSLCHSLFPSKHSSARAQDGLVRCNYICQITNPPESSTGDNRFERLSLVKPIPPVYFRIMPAFILPANISSWPPFILQGIFILNSCKESNFIN